MPSPRSPQLPHLLQGVWGDLLAPPKHGPVVLGGEALQLGAQRLLLLRHDPERARLRGGEAVGAPQTAPQLPAPTGSSGTPGSAVG